MALLELVDVSKSFGGVKAVDRFSLTVEKGELVGLIGPNGAGKTTVFNIVTGLYPSEGGQILFRGEDIAPLKPHEIVPKGIARTFQNLRLFARSSALENVMTAYRKGIYSFMEALCHVGRWKKTEEEAKARGMELLDLVGIADRADQPAGTLPYGHQRRVEIARALALEPELLLLDEPAAGMNAEEVEGLNATIKRITAELGVTIVVIEHHMELVMEICPRIVCMNFGAKIAEGSPQEIQNHPGVLAAYLGEEV
ncbi:ABC transporter ATP-binding protein [Acetomicrobium sp. S15 = DSM 107314]|jgi:branched-chain amino acid transport system ATP-binding protein|uniref:ABC transporter ATP-binding protein n=1 Tax=Acetomicrobium sp. S15 = DSM 107314 TaxID=2529858 RepID=UPI0018E18E3C|nr:ABC transporter ATP-binding protein [Acetomicrobium sp. S15 = DSM 107314]